MCLHSFRVGVIAVAVASLLVACDGADQTKTSFAQRYRRITADYRQRTQAIATQADAASGGVDAVVETYRDVLESTRIAADAYQELEPPDDFETPFNRLVRSLTQQVATLDRLLDAAEEEDAAGVSRSVSTLAEQLADWQSAVVQMKRLLDDCEECRA